MKKSININESQFNAIVSKCVKKALKEGQGWDFFKGTLKNLNSASDSEVEDVYNRTKTDEWKKDNADFINNTNGSQYYSKEGAYDGPFKGNKKVNNSIVGKLGRWAGLKGAETALKGKHFLNKFRNKGVATEGVRKKRIMKESDADLETYWQNLVDYNIATDEEIRLVTSINGWSVDTLDDILYVRTAYRSWEQFAEAEGIE